MANKDFVNQEYKNRAGNVYVNVSDVVSGLYQFSKSAREAVENASEETATILEASMKKNAPWNDITGKARQGLKAKPFKEGSIGLGFRVGIRLQHSVKYGVFLEYNGLYHREYLSRRRPILVPTMQSEEALVFLTKIKEQFSKIPRRNKL